MTRRSDTIFGDREARCKAAGGEDECRRPYFFVDRQSEIEQEARECQYGADDKQAAYALAVVFGTQYQSSADKAYEHVGNRRQRTQQPLRVEFETDTIDSVGVHVVFTKHLVVDNRYHIVVGESEAVAEEQYHGVDNEHGSDNPWQRPVGYEQCHCGTYAVT